MRLSDAQKEFAFHVGCLLVHIGKMPHYSCTLGDAYRDPRVHGHLGDKKSYSSANSRHKERLAIDINLFHDNLYLRNTEAYRSIGEYWISLHPNNKWGGHFNKKDGNHFQRDYP